MKKSPITLLLLLIMAFGLKAYAAPFRIIGYYCGPSALVDSFETERLTHLIFCFGHLSGNRFEIGNAADSATIEKMVLLKKKHPALKVMLSLGGWSGCKTCSDVFNSAQGRQEFARSVKEVSDYFHTDGIDLDWEYPAIKGFPGHTFRAEDRDNFTDLLKELRAINGTSFEISFAAGGFTEFIQNSIDWKEAIQYADFVNIMSYDLVHGYSKHSGHHTPLFSTPQQLESTDHAVQLLRQQGVPAEKLIIGAAFYGRFFQIDPGHPVDLYQPGFFLHSFSYKFSADSLSVTNGFTTHWDSVAQAPYAINEKRRLVATYDDDRSVASKTSYARQNKLGGIMFWQLIDDKFKGGLLEKMVGRE